MFRCVIFDSLGDRVIQKSTIRCVDREDLKPANRTKNNLTLTQKELDGIRKRLRHAFPKNQVGVILMAEHPLARRIRDRSHKLREAYFIPSVDEFLDLIFHETNSGNSNVHCQATG